MVEIHEGFTNNNTITFTTLVGLANGSTAVSNVVDNTSDLFLSADIQVKFRTTTPTSSTGYVAVILQRTADNGTTFDDATEDEEVLALLVANTDNTTFTTSVSTAKTGTLQSKWRLAIKNMSGAAFDGTPANFSVKFLGRYIRTIP